MQQPMPESGSKGRIGIEEEYVSEVAAAWEVSFHAKIGIFDRIFLYLPKKILYLHTLSDGTVREACPERWVSG